MSNPDTLCSNMWGTFESIDALRQLMSDKLVPGDLALVDDNTYVCTKCLPALTPERRGLALQLLGHRRVTGEWTQITSRRDEDEES